MESNRIRFRRTEAGLRLLLPESRTVKVDWNYARKLADWIKENMPKVWEPQDINVYRGWLEAINSEASDRLNDWENTFMDSIETRLNVHARNLTEGQANSLERIYVKYTT